MITDAGAQAAQRAVAGQRVGLASHIAVGVGDTTATAADQTLDFEIRRVEIDSVSIDYANDYVIYKGTLPPEVVGEIREIGLVNNNISPNSVVTDFASDGVQWSAGAASSTYSRVGVESLRVNPGVSATLTPSSNLSMILTNAYEVIVAYHVVTAPSSMSVRFRTDTSNYYSASLPTTTGYHIERISVASGLSTTGSPSSIDSVALVVTSTGGASADVHFDAIATVSGQESGELSARHVLASPKAKTSTRALEIEYSLVVSV